MKIGDKVRLTGEGGAYMPSSMFSDYIGQIGTIIERRSMHVAPWYVRFDDGEVLGCRESELQLDDSTKGQRT